MHKNSLASITLLVVLLFSWQSTVVSAQTTDINRDSDLENAEILIQTIQVHNEKISRSLNKIQTVAGKKPASINGSLLKHLEGPIQQSRDLPKFYPSATSGTEIRKQIESVTKLNMQISNEKPLEIGTRNERTKKLIMDILAGGSHGFVEFCNYWPRGSASEFYQNVCK